MTLTIRKPIQAGRFYPVLESELNADLTELFSKAEKLETVTSPKAIVAPHAGYLYSGITAAHGYKQIEGMDFDRVILVAPSHYERFNGAAIFNCDSYQTPLGNIPVDRQFVESLVDQSPLAQFSDTVELQEHSLEVQLPFLQKSLKSFSLVPIIISKLDSNDSNALAYAIKQQLEKNNQNQKTLLVASSDLYHGHSHQECLVSDTRFKTAIENFEAEPFDKGNREKEFMACGAAAIGLVMRLAKSLGAKKAKTIHQSTSRDAVPNSDYVVGYAAVIIE